LGGILGIIITPLLLAVLVSYLLSPLVNYLQNQGLSRSMGIIAIYLFLTAIFTLLCLYLLPSLLQELQELVNALPGYTEKYFSFFERMETNYRRFQIPEGVRAALDKNIREMQKLTVINLEKFSEYLLALFSHALALLLVPLFSFYFLRDHERIKGRFLGLIPPSYQKRVGDALLEINHTLGAYLRGIFLLSISVGGLMYLGLLILGVDFALFLGILNALTNIIPYFGPLIGALPVILIALFEGPPMVWKVIILIIVVQQLENQFIAPEVLGRNLGFHPLTIILAILIGGSYFGFLGLILTIPFIAILRIILRYFWPFVVQAWKETRGLI
jgi:predicted PurR-regulated permease PerM